MPEESIPVDPEAGQEALEEVLADEETARNHEAADSQTSDAVAARAKAKKRKAKKTNLEKTSESRSLNGEGSSSGDRAAGGASQSPAVMLQKMLEINPSLKAEVAAMKGRTPEELLQLMSLSNLMGGVAIGGKNQKDMKSYKFWQTQPVPSFDDPKVEEGPIKIIEPENVPQEPSPLPEGFEWVTMDLTEQKQLDEVYELLNGHYVEDEEAMFRFRYSVSFLNWALKSPGWRKEWHVGVRVSQSQKLVAFISGVPQELRVRSKVLHCSEINFLCIHKKLRSKRLAPVLIKEITRRCYAVGVWQAIYTAGVVLPKPVSSCRYYHRSLDWLKLFQVGFSPLPPNSTRERQVIRYRLPRNTSTKGLRPMHVEDVDAVLKLLKRYLKRFKMAPEYTKDEVEHWMLHRKESTSEQIVWSYVVEDPESHKITDFFSFYCLESSVIGNRKHDKVRAAYLFYYATEVAFQVEENKEGVGMLKKQLNALMGDALILAKQLGFDVFNALTLLDNPLFLESQKFGPGDGQLHYYLYNYRTNPIVGGVDEHNDANEVFRGGVGVVML
ncbi:MAG: glycylpeptide N-tetradecanoyltransferase [Candelina submexicana]|nr:MAG: glycylpeptide N-tetradecanoyltransferase [Candelina submexicana]